MAVRKHLALALLLTLGLSACASSEPPQAETPPTRQTQPEAPEPTLEEQQQAVLVSHNIVACLDADYPASLSPAVHALLRDRLGFDGVIMTDDLAMQAVTDFTGDENAAVLAVQAGNDLIISSDFVTQYHAVLDAVKNGTLRKNDIEQAAQRVILWKIQLGLISF